MSAATYARDAEFDAGLVAPKPFVKWAGGKRQLLPELFKHVPPKFGRYFEPFVGGGALFFALAAQGGIDATLGDATAPLILTYKACASDVDGLVEALEWHAARYSEEHYYATREAFNRAGGRVGVAGAARFVYLNRTGFNGLWRVNRDGGFNVPFGDYKNPAICDAANLRACARALRGVGLLRGDFEQTAADARRGDLVYFDPPYWPVSETADFTSYTPGGFGRAEQERLAGFASALRARGAHVVLSNADVPGVRRLYRGWHVRRVEARRNINSKASARGVVGEVIIYT